MPSSVPNSKLGTLPHGHPRTSTLTALPWSGVLSHTATISAARLRAHVAILASDSFEGRGPNTAGLEKAAKYLEQQLKSLGLQPAFSEGKKKSFRQPFKMLVQSRIAGLNTLGQDSLKLTVGTDFAPYLVSSSGKASGELLFLGYGIKAPELDYDDFASTNAHGKIVVVLSGEPGDDDPKSPFDGRRITRHTSLASKLVLAREAGAQALLVVKEKLSPIATTPETDGGLLVAELTFEAAAQLLGFDLRSEKAAIDSDFKPRQRTGGAAQLQFNVERIHRTVYNIGAYWSPKTSTTETVVIGAHYDHLGMGDDSSLAADKAPQVHNGADDNASGTAVVLEVARQIKQTQGLKRRILFLWFAGEERGLLGSAHFVRSWADKGDLVAMVNLDMVGRLRNSKLNVMGTSTARQWVSLLEPTLAARQLKGSLGGDGYGPSDHTSFYAEGVPVLFLFTGAHADYHKPSDDPATLNYLGMAQVGAVATDIVASIARSPDRPTYVRAPPPPAPTGGGGYGPYFGSIPDFGEDVKGVLLSGVRDGSPAARAGVKKGDIIVRFAGLAVLNLQDFTEALRRCAPGDEVTFEIQREGQKLELKTVLGRRE